MAQTVFGNAWHLGRTSTFVVSDVGQQVGATKPRASVSSPDCSLDGVICVFNVAWGSCKIVGDAPEAARVQVVRRVHARFMLLHCFIDILDMYLRVRGHHRLPIFLNTSLLLVSWKMMGAMEKVRWVTLLTLNWTKKPKGQTQLLILTLGRRLRPITAMMDVIIARMASAHMFGMSSLQS